MHKTRKNRLETLETRLCIRMKEECTRRDKGSHKPKKKKMQKPYGENALPWVSNAGSGGVEVTTGLRDCVSFQEEGEPLTPVFFGKVRTAQESASPARKRQLLYC